jgi:hypothetical protein
VENLSTSKFMLTVLGPSPSNDAQVQLARIVRESADPSSRLDRWLHPTEAAAQDALDAFADSDIGRRYSGRGRGRSPTLIARPGRKARDSALYQLCATSS